jgi:riboflavin synthase alpha subunit
VGWLNLELPMRADGRFGGHIVQGHVDGHGRVSRTGIESRERTITGCGLKYLRTWRAM